MARPSCSVSSALKVVRKNGLKVCKTRKNANPIENAKRLLRKNDIKTHVKYTLKNKEAAATNPWLEFKKTIKNEGISNIVTYEPNGVKYVVIGKGGIVAKASDSEYSQDENKNRKTLRQQKQAIEREEKKAKEERKKAREEARKKAKQAKAPKAAKPPATKKNKKAANKKATPPAQQSVPMATRRSARFIRS